MKLLRRFKIREYIGETERSFYFKNGKCYYRRSCYRSYSYFIFTNIEEKQISVWDYGGMKSEHLFDQFTEFFQVFHKIFKIKLLKNKERRLIEEILRK